MRTRLCIVLTLLAIPVMGRAEERTERFDADPHWDGLNHRALVPEPQQIVQDFGYSPTQHAGGSDAGEIGGWTTPAAEPAYYAQPIAEATFDDRLSLSGKLNCTGRQFHVLVGFFNSGSVDEWRTSNSIFLRLYGRGDVFYAYVEYCTSQWRAGGDSPGGFTTITEAETGRQQLHGFESNAVHDFSIDYDPDGNNGGGAIIVTIGDETATCHLDEGHKQDGAIFNRCGLLNIPKSYDSGGDVWLDDLVINDELESFDSDPEWEAVGNRRTYLSDGVRPRFDFGYSETHFANGQSNGELGGVVFRGDCRYPERLAYYGDRLDSLTTDHPLTASGKVALRRGVSDSTTLLGFFHSTDSMKVSDSQSAGFPLNFLGVVVEGPSREGFLFYPAYRFAEGGGYTHGPGIAHILPDGEAHDWTLEYQPLPTMGPMAKSTITFDGQEARLEVPGRIPRHPRPVRSVRTRHHLDRWERSDDLLRRSDVHVPPD